MENLRCVICIDTVSCAHLCPRCTKLFCQSCINKAFDAAPIQSCPHCRRPVNRKAFIKIPWMEELKSIMPNADICKKHPTNRYIMYCSSQCLSPLCADCWVNHDKRHRIKPLQVEYEAKVEHWRELKEKTGKEKGKEISQVRSKFCNRISKEGLGYIETYTQKNNLPEMKEVMERYLVKERDAFIKPRLEKFCDTVSEWKKYDDKLSELESFTMINTFIEKAKELSSPSDLKLIDVNQVMMDEVLQVGQELDNVDPLQFLTHWLPPWDVKEAVLVQADPGKTDAERFPYHYGVIALFAVEDVDMNWTVCLSCYLNLHLIVRKDDVRKFVPQTEYEVVIENRKKEDTAILRQVQSAPPCIEKFEFSFFNTKDWEDDDGNLSFWFKVRPLSYASKFEDIKTVRRNLKRRAALTTAGTSIPIELLNS